MNLPKNKKAFTIIELIVVIVVVGILIGIAVPKIKGMQDNANIAKANKELLTIKAALESYRTFGSSQIFPIATTTITNLQATYLAVSSTSPKLITNILYDPFVTTSQQEYSYMSSPNGMYYMVWSVGPSGQGTGQGIPTSISNTGDVTY